MMISCVSTGLWTTDRHHFLRRGSFLKSRRATAQSVFGRMRPPSGSPKDATSQWVNVRNAASVNLGSQRLLDRLQHVRSAGCPSLAGTAQSCRPSRSSTLQRSFPEADVRRPCSIKNLQMTAVRTKPPIVAALTPRIVPPMEPPRAAPAAPRTSVAMGEPQG